MTMSGAKSERVSSVNHESSVRASSCLSQCLSVYDNGQTDMVATTTKEKLSHSVSAWGLLQHRYYQRHKGEWPPNGLGDLFFDNGVYFQATGIQWWSQVRRTRYALFVSTNKNIVRTLFQSTIQMHHLPCFIVSPRLQKPHRRDEKPWQRKETSCSQSARTLKRRETLTIQSIRFVSDNLSDRSFASIQKKRRKQTRNTLAHAT